ncbi:hypothetical protein M2299_000297 [Stenotrophomonas sp. 1278]|uniref:DUF3653 domain-containing protein n=1 Tax=Stenotrophomonas sp. 1278 TaxID=2940566 RepID=UPI002474A066|nr:DUF3653 domain-containing protein [Stenotrophomonas sp. 1278]MDH6329497.1 hypothetical protein [Stenotrophomonas sp. 1278]
MGFICNRPTSCEFVLVGGASRQARAQPQPLPAEPTKAAQRRSLCRTRIISHNVYYVQAHPGLAGTPLASPPGPAAAWSLIVRDRNLTGPWAGFSFKGGRLVTPEGRELYPEDLAWLSLTAAQAQEWRRMMGELCSGPRSGKSRNRCSTSPAARDSFSAGRAEVVTLSTIMADRKKRSAVAMTGPDAEPPAAVLPVPGPRRRQRV